MSNVYQLNNNYSFRGSNLTKARVLSNLTITELSELTEISKQSISKYENSKAVPSIANLSKLSETLKVPINFFFSNIFDHDPEQKLGFFRKKSRVSKKDMKKAETYALLTWIWYSKISHTINFPKYSDPISIAKSKDFRKFGKEYVQQIAESLRKQFKLGMGPLLNLTGFLESLGIIINFIDLDDLGIDAYTTVFQGVPVIIINSGMTSSSRIRFNLAHEFAHILFHSEYKKDYQVGDEHNIIEEEANYFAGCFLVPEEGLVKDLNGITLEYYVSLKSHWNVSIAALITRSNQLGLISDSHTLHLRQQMSRKKMRIKEPLDDTLKIEKPIMIEAAYNALKKKNESNVIFNEFPIGDYYSNVIYKKNIDNQINLRNSLNLL